MNHRDFRIARDAMTARAPAALVDRAPAPVPSRRLGVGTAAWAAIVAGAPSDPQRRLPLTPTERRAPTAGSGSRPLAQLGEVLPGQSLRHGVLTSVSNRLPEPRASSGQHG